MTAIAMLMGAATAPDPAPYVIAPEFLFRVTASHPTSLATLQAGGKLHLAIVAAGGAGSAVKIFINGVPGTTGTRGNPLGNTGYLDLLRAVKCEFAEVLLREVDATSIPEDPLYIAPGETTFTPPTGPYLLEE